MLYTSKNLLHQLVHFPSWIFVCVDARLFHLYVNGLFEQSRQLLGINCPVSIEG